MTNSIQDQNETTEPHDFCCNPFSLKRIAKIVFFELFNCNMPIILYLLEFKAIKMLCVLNGVTPSQFFGWLL